MDKGKIVALEDRIPKLKEQRRRKANKRLIFLLFLFFTMIAVVAYVQSPLSHVQKITVSGNELLPTEEIIKITDITSETNIWSIKKQDIVSKLQDLHEIRKAEVKMNWPNSISIKIEERKRVAYVERDNAFFPVMENGNILMDRKVSGLPTNAPILFDFKEGDILQEMIAGLDELPDAILNSISEIHYTPKKTDKYHISLFMNDGFEVSATLRSFTEKMVHYPSIISQLDPDTKGIIDLEVGSYFKAYETEVEETEVENEKGEG
nr:FtsQ-type POTRA domain-containing protein [Neobacillus sp. Marseille-Q6967]